MTGDGQVISENDHPAKPALKESSAPAFKRRILVAEDKADTRESLRRLLEATLPVNVDTVSDGSQALKLLEKAYAVLLTDLKMPHVDGMQLIKEIQTRRLPVTVIVTTGYGSIDEAVKAMQLGAYDFLSKPADPEHLCLVIHSRAATQLWTKWQPCVSSWAPGMPLSTWSAKTHVCTRFSS